MCGIAGIFNYQSSIEPSIERNVKKMLSVIHHRGPDESGIYLNQNVGLGSVRLSIIDLSTGQQPLSDESGRYWIAYNGEIFNYLELKLELEKKGFRFKTNCDTEVVVQMYAHYGIDCLNRFNGQFAFSIWDKQKKELFLARDRVGIRPLFYWSQYDMFAFCSEIKGLFVLDKIEKAINPESLSQIFTFWTTLTPHTPFKNILELQPGHYMIVNSTGISISKFWKLDFPDRNEIRPSSLSNNIEELDELLRDAVRIRLKADVPVGAYLSGGLDSSITTAYINQINPDILNTFSIGFHEKEYDETNFQMEAAHFFNTNHKAFSCTSEDIVKNLEEAIWHTEFPILRTSPVPMFLLSKKVSQNNIKVVITGEGADEFLAGYNIFKEAKVRRFWAKDPTSVTRPRLLAKLYPYLPILKNSPDLALKMFFGFQLTETNNPLYSHLLRWHNTSRIKSFFSDDFSTLIGDKNPVDELYKNLPQRFEQWSDLAQSQYLEATIFMSGYLLSSQGDRMSMGNSVEGRYPFLDYRLIEFCSQLPDRQKLNCLDEKFILKKLSKGKIPQIITNRQKQPYRAPIASLLNSKQVPTSLMEILTDRSLNSFGIFNTSKINSLNNSILQQRIVSETDQMALIGVMSTQILYKKFISETIEVNEEVLRNYHLIDNTSN